MNTLWWWVVWLVALVGHGILSTQQGNPANVTETVAYNMFLFALILPTGLLLLRDPVLTQLPGWLRATGFAMYVATIPLLILTTAARVQPPTKDVLARFLIIQTIPALLVCICAVYWVVSRIYSTPTSK